MLKAEFTMCYEDVLQLYPDVTENIQMDTEDHTSKLLNMIRSMWGIYEISGETIPEFKLFLTNKFNQYKDYYTEMLNAYETELRWIDGMISVDTYDLTDEEDETFTPKVTMTTTDTPRVKIKDEHYDLPRSTSAENRPSSVDVSEPIDGTNERVVSPDGENSNDTHRDKTKSGTVSTSTADQVVQREKYLKSIRSLYAEFAAKFKPCFLDMYW